jgi:hypothetical protein
MDNNKVQLVLKSANIFVQSSGGLLYSSTSPFAPFERTGDVTNGVGFINRWQSKMTWNNVDIETLLGHMYEKNNLYSLKLNSVTFGITSNLSTFTSAENNRFFNVFITGLTFSNEKTEHLLCTVRVPSGAQAYIFNYFDNEALFYADEPLKNITIEYRDFLIDTNEPIGASNTHAFPHAQFVFTLSKVV